MPRGLNLPAGLSKIFTLLAVHIQKTRLINSFLALWIRFFRPRETVYLPYRDQKDIIEPEA
jgi:hypothetical protein